MELQESLTLHSGTLVEVNLCIEDEDENSSNDTWSVDSSRFILELKLDIEQKHRIPVASQVWFVENEACDDTSRLSTYNVANGSNVYITVFHKENQSNGLVTVTLCIEGEDAIDQITFPMNPDWSILDFKNKIEDTYSIPAVKQKWIIEKSVADDNRQLSSFDVQDGTRIYISVVDTIPPSLEMAENDESLFTTEHLQLRNNKTDVVCVKLYIQGDNRYPNPVNCSMDSSCSIQDLKYKVEDSFDIPVVKQKWIIDCNIVSDSRLLSSYNVADESEIYVTVIENTTLSSVEKPENSHSLPTLEHVQSQNDQGDIICLTLYIEGDDRYLNPVKCSMDSTRSINELKYKIEASFGIPVASQMWIIDRDIASDSSLLSSYNVVEETEIYITVIDHPLFMETHEENIVESSYTLEDTNRQNYQDGIICITLYIEGDDHYQNPVKCSMDSTRSINELKYKIEDSFDIPVANQMWIIDRDIASDSRLLNSYNVNEESEIYITVTDNHLFMETHDTNDESSLRLEPRTPHNHQEDVICVTLCIEGDNHHTNSVKCSIDSTRTINELKYKVEDSFDIPAVNQTWIIDGNIASDSRLLNSYNVDDETEIYITVTDNTDLPMETYEITDEPSFSLEQTTPQSYQDGVICLQVYIEGDERYPNPLKCSMDSSRSINELKYKIENNFDIPVVRQMWIIHKDIASDSRLLSSYNLDHNTEIYITVNENLASPLLSEAATTIDVEPTDNHVKQQHNVRVQLCIEGVAAISEPIPFLMDSDWCICDLKYKIEDNYDIPVIDQEWDINGDKADNDRLLNSYDIYDDMDIHIYVTKSPAHRCAPVEDVSPPFTENGACALINDDTSSEAQKLSTVKLQLFIEDDGYSGLSEETVKWHVQQDQQISQLKKEIEEIYAIPVANQSWIIEGDILQDSKSLSSYNVTDDTELYISVVDTSTPSPLVRHSYNNVAKRPRQAITHNREVRVEIYVEDDSNQQKPFKWKMIPSQTIVKLKSDLVNIISIPVCNQMWFIGRDIAEDTETLTTYNVEDGTQIFICFTDCPASSFVKQEETRYCEDDSTSHLIQSSTLNLIPSSSSNLNPDWTCPACTYVNISNRPGCEMCGTEKPEQCSELQMYTEQKRNNYTVLLTLDDVPLALCPRAITCLICENELPPHEGIALHNCLHEFCRDCLIGTIENADSVEIRCPYKDDAYQCEDVLQDREIRALLSGDRYAHHLKKSVRSAQGAMPNAFQCQTPDCSNWCVTNNEAREFSCDICGHINCLQCKAIHEGITCMQYQNQFVEDLCDEDGTLTASAIQMMLSNGEAMMCPDCQTVIMKDGGCDALRCRACRLQLCWATKGRRWGPRGVGDTSGGCRCRCPNKCAPDCKGCDYPHGEPIEPLRWRYQRWL